MLKAIDLLTKKTQEEIGTGVSSDKSLDKLGSMLLEWTFKDPTVKKLVPPVIRRAD